MNTAPAARALYPAHTVVRRTEAIVLWVAGVSPMWLVWIVVAHVTKDPRPWSLGLLLATTVLVVGVWHALSPSVKRHFAKARESRAY